MNRYRGTGNLAIRPCGICSALVLHEEGEGEEAAAPRGGKLFLKRHWRAFPHHAPGGAICIGGGAVSRALRQALRRSRDSKSKASDPA